MSRPAPRACPGRPTHRLDGNSARVARFIRRSVGGAVIRNKQRLIGMVIIDAHNQYIVQAQGL